VLTTFVLGAGASLDAGYPLATTMATGLLQWMKFTNHDPQSYAAQYPATAEFLEECFGARGNIEDLITAIECLIEAYENGTREQRLQRSLVANKYSVLKNAVRAWFKEIQLGSALNSSTYGRFAQNVVAPGDCVITFNYDVSLDRDLRAAGKFDAGNGYGFRIEGLPSDSKTRLLKLHGSVNWLALLFSGSTSGVSQFQFGHTLGSRPVIGRDELSFLGYSSATDISFRSDSAGMPVMIFPGRSKQFFFDANTGREYGGFWDDLWSQAQDALSTASRLVICGYSLPTADERACQLLLNALPKHADVVVVSGNDTGGIVNRFKSAGYVRTKPGKKVFFGDWINQ
jgi:hypothetical protein